MVTQRRRWVNCVGYTINGVKDPCQCNLSTGKCKCGKRGQRMTTRAERLRQEALSLLERANEMESNQIPEPVGCEDGTNVIFFKKQFKPHDRYYSYSAVRANNTNGLWFMTGQLVAARTAYSWEGLVEWIQLGSDYEIWTCTSFELLAPTQR